MTNAEICAASARLSSAPSCCNLRVRMVKHRESKFTHSHWECTTPANLCNKPSHCFGTNAAAAWTCLMNRYPQNHILSLVLFISGTSWRKVRCSGHHVNTDSQQTQHLGAFLVISSNLLPTKTEKKHPKPGKLLSEVLLYLVMLWEKYQCQQNRTESCHVGV